LKTLITLFLLVFFGGFVIRFLQPFVLVIAGLPGVILGGMYTNRTKPRFILGTIVSAIGQSYVNLAFVACTVAYASAAVQRDDVIGFFDIDDSLQVITRQRDRRSRSPQRQPERYRKYHRGQDN